jgi:hypothetical protein
MSEFPDGSCAAVLPVSPDRALFLPLQVSYRIAANRRFGPKNEPARAGARCARSGGLGEVHGTS